MQRAFWGAFRSQWEHWNLFIPDVGQKGAFTHRNTEAMLSLLSAEPLQHLTPPEFGTQLLPTFINAKI